MKKISLFLVTLCVALFFYSVNKSTHAEPLLQEKIHVVEEGDLNMWILSDPHFIAPELFDDGAAFSRMEATSAGKDLKHIPALMEALVWQANHQKPDLIIVTGDLTFNGEYQSMVGLAEYFRRIEEGGTQVSVIPGNHDIHSGWARKFIGEEMEVVEQVSPDDFKELFADYGYDLAISEDSHSLSYIIEPKRGYPFLMLDTNSYSDSKSTKAPPAEGQIRKETYTWLDDYFATQTDAPQTYVVSHHPQLNHSGKEGSQFSILDDEYGLEYFIEKGVQTSFAGHIHAQDITSAEVGDSTFYEIITGALSIYPNSVGTIKLSEDYLEYAHESLDVEGWAESTNQQSLALLEYKKTGHDFFKEDGESLAIQQMAEERWYDKQLSPDVKDFIGRMNVRYFSGEDYIEGNEAEVIQEITSHPGYQIIQENSTGFLKRYSNQLLQDQNLNDQVISIPHNN
ncbi:metallophosphoesterase [Jeotgalibaca sp. MA1X17-3]|uniref:metallophosphoesterase n=1 Tax=Jeotgalibaca sp. MA1X17-3 TaxID=2908211 RepID=UPI001F2AFFC2|nr:metallophosphoesterase [Jeotgalibaca sp. MA1X17-3]UJF15935.1 metallophosphoesterase [Jeotgalibaca sp. MA1X17-3]